MKHHFRLAALLLSIVGTANLLVAQAQPDVCGKRDEDCCEGEKCNPGLTCATYIVTDIARLVCLKPDGCGQTGGVCCDGKIKCLNENTDRCSAYNKCETIDCGEEGEECCNANGLPPPDFTGCNEGLQCRDGQCVQSCGANDQECCFDDGSTIATCDKGLDCVDYIIGDTVRNVCKAPGCGETGEPCCEGTIKCLQGNLDRCNRSNHCEKIDCGEEGEVCCPPNGKPPPGFTGCQSDLQCRKGTCAKKCGKARQMCCAGRKCNRPFLCIGGICRTYRG